MSPQDVAAKLARAVIPAPHLDTFLQLSVRDQLIALACFAHGAGEPVVRDLCKLLVHRHDDRTHGFDSDSAAHTFTRR